MLDDVDGPDRARRIGEWIDRRRIVGFSANEEEEQLDRNDGDSGRLEPLVVPEPPHTHHDDGEELWTGEQELLHPVCDRSVCRAAVVERVGDAVPVVPNLPGEVWHQEKDRDAEAEPWPAARQV